MGAKLNGKAYFRFVLIFSISMIATAAQASEWTVRKVFGDVWIQSGPIQQVALAAGKRVFEKATIVTGENRKTILTRGAEVVTIGRNSRITLPAAGKTDRTTIPHRSGTVIYNVRKRPSRHFGVETPNLIAIVKGTEFRIDESPSASAVSVYSGFVEVTSPASGQTVLAEPGQTALLDGKRNRIILLTTPDASIPDPKDIGPKGRPKGAGAQAASSVESMATAKTSNGIGHAYGHDKKSNGNGNGNGGSKAN